MELSVLTPSYNYATFMPTAIESVVSTRQFEHVIWDGNSTDGTQQVLESYKGHVNWASRPDEGQSDALNRALEMSSGKYIAWLNADDFYLPGGLDECVRFLEENPQYAAVQGDTVLVDIDGNVQKILFGYRVPYAVLASRGCVIASTSTVFRRSALGDQPWDKELRYLMDWDVYLSIMEGGNKIAYLPRLIAAMRIHDGQVTAGRRGRNTSEHHHVRAKHQLGWRGAPPCRFAADVVHKLLKERDTRIFGTTQVKNSNLCVLDASGHIAPDAVTELRSRVYGSARPTEHPLS